MNLEPIYRDHFVLLPSVPAVFMESQSYFNCARRAAQFHPALIVDSPLNAVDQTDTKIVTMLLDKCIARKAYRIKVSIIFPEYFNPCPLKPICCALKHILQLVVY